MLIRVSVFCFTILAANFSYADSLSKWDQFVKNADQKKVLECVFPDAPDNKAPDWLCNHTIPGVEISAVGAGKYIEPAEGKEDRYVEKHKGYYRNYIPGSVKAYMNALVKVKKELDVVVQKMVKEFLLSTGNADPEKIDSVMKNVSSFKSVSGNSVYNGMIKTYIETTKAGEEKVSSVVEKLLYNSKDCQFIYKNYAETQTGASNKPTTNRAESSVHRGQCGFNKLVEDMEKSGYKLLNMIKSPKGQYYVLIGFVNIRKEAERHIKNSKEGDSKLWQEFMKKKK